MPQVFTPGETRYRILPDLFKFYATGEVCDVLDFAFDRIRKNIFGRDYVPPEERNEQQQGGDIKGKTMYKHRVVVCNL